jgi:glycosyltransferase involved in cell wall biosynthesis
MTKILFTTPILEYPAAGGPALRIENSVKALSRVSELCMVSRSEKDLIGGERAESFYRSFCGEFAYAPSARVSANRYLRKIEREWHRRFSLRVDSDFILNLADKHKIDVIWFGYANLSARLIYRTKMIRPGIKVVYDTDCVLSRFILREIPFESDPRRRIRIEKCGRMAESIERKTINICEVITAVSDVDAEYYRGISMHPERVMTFSNVIDLAAYEDIPPSAQGFKKPCIYLAGTFGHPHSPMDRAAHWMVKEVLPRVKREVPEIHFYIVGKGSDAFCGRLKDPSITVTGRVQSVLPYLCHADVAVVPLQFESGTRFKILEAGACGIPVVSTTLGAEGLPVVNRRELLLADTPEDFALSIVELLKNKELAGSVGLNCRKMITERYGIENLTVEAERILRYLKQDDHG